MAQIVGFPGGFGVGDTTARTNTTSTPPVPLGTVGYDASGNEYRYVRFGGTAAAGTAIIPASTATPFDAVVVSTGANQQLVGINLTAAVANDCGWVMRSGAASGVSGGTLTAGTNKTTAAAGALGDSAAGDLNDTVGIMILASPATLFVKGL